MPNSNKFIGPTNQPIEGIEYESPQTGYISSNKDYTEPKLEELAEVNWVPGSPVIPDNGKYKQLYNSEGDTFVSIASRANNALYTAIKVLTGTPTPVDEDYEIVAFPSNYSAGFMSRIYTKNLEYVWDIPRPASGDIGLVRNTSISRDGNLVAFGTPYADTQFPVFQYNSWEWVGNPTSGNEMPYVGSSLTLAVFSPIQDILVFLFNTTIVVYDTNTWNKLYESSGEINSVSNPTTGVPCWSPDGTKLFYISSSSLVNYIDLSNPSVPTFHLVNDTFYSSSVCIHTEDYLISVGAGNPSIRIWNTGDYSGTSTLVATGELPFFMKLCASVSPDGQLFLCSVNSSPSTPLFVFDINTWTSIPVESPPDSLTIGTQGGLSWSPDGKYVYLGCTLEDSKSRIIKYNAEDWTIDSIYDDEDGTGYGYGSLLVLPKITTPPPPEVWIDVTGPEFWEDYYKDDIFWDYSNYEWDSGNERWRLTEASTTSTTALLRPINGWETGLRFSKFRVTLNSGTNINSGILSEGTYISLRSTGPDITDDTEAVFSNWNEEVVIELTIYPDVDFDLSRLSMSTYLYNDGPYITKIEYQPI